MNNDEKIDLKIIDSITEKNMGKPGALMTILQEVQEELGFLPEIVLEKISDNTGIPASKIFGVVTFYSQFSMIKKGKYLVRICEGTACHVSGAPDIMQSVCDTLGIKEGETTDDKLFTVEAVACLGCCSLAPAIMVNDIDSMEKLGIYEVAPEDFALCEYGCTSKIGVQQIVREGLDNLRNELG